MGVIYLIERRIKDEQTATQESLTSLQGKVNTGGCQGQVLQTLAGLSVQFCLDAVQEAIDQYGTSEIINNDLGT